MFPATQTQLSWTVSIRQRLASNEAWALADQAMVSGSNFLTGVLLTRYMGMREFGIFTLAWMAVLFVNSLQMALIVAPMMSIGPKQQANDVPRYYGAVVLQEVLFAIGSTAALLLFAALAVRFLPEWDLGELSLPLAFASLAFQLQDFLRRYFFSLSRRVAGFANDAVSYLLQIVILLVLFRVGSPDTAGVLWVTGATSLVAFLLGLPLLRDLVWPEGAFMPVVRRHWRFSRWLVASSLMQWSSGNLFVAAAPLFMGPAAAGVLKAGQNIFGVCHIWYQGLENILPAQAARTYDREGNRGLANYLGRTTLLWGGVTALFALLIAIAPHFWFRLVYGEGFGEYAFVLRWYAVVYVAGYVTMPLRTALRALEHTSPIFWSYLGVTIFSVMTAVPLVRTFGITGVMAGMVATHVLAQAILAVGIYSRVRKTAPITGTPDGASETASPPL